MRPDRFRAVAGLSIPYMPRTDQQPTRALKQFAGERFSYILYFQAPGVAEAEIEADVPRLLRAVYHTHSAEGAAQRAAAPRVPPVPRDARWLDTLIDPAPLPAWLTPADLAVCSDAFTRSGFHGPLNWYRAIDRTWELMAPWRNAPVTVPALFMCGEEDRCCCSPPGGQGTAADRAAADQERAAAGLRPLDPAGAAGRGECGASGVPCHRSADARCSAGLAAPGLLVIREGRRHDCGGVQQRCPSVPLLFLRGRRFLLSVELLPKLDQDRGGALGLLDAAIPWTTWPSP